MKRQRTKKSLDKKIVVEIDENSNEDPTSLEVTYSWHKGDPGKYTGPYEYCYPGEPDDVEIMDIWENVYIESTNDGKVNRRRVAWKQRKDLLKKVEDDIKLYELIVENINVDVEDTLESYECDDADNWYDSMRDGD